MLWKWLATTLALFVVPAVALAAISLMARKPKNLGVADGRLAACPHSPNCVGSQEKDAARAIDPLKLGCADATCRQRRWALLRELLKAWPRTTVVQATDTYLHAECRTRVFGFVDDMEFLLQDDGTVQVRAAARSGYSDLGANRKRVEDFRRELGKLVERDAGTSK